MNIIDAIQDEYLFRSFIGDPDSWNRWFAALKAIYGLELSPFDRKVINKCTGRNHGQLPKKGFNRALFLTGRRSGKSRIASIIGAFEAILADNDINLAKGEKGVLPIVSPTKDQSKIVHGYLRAIFDSSEMLKSYVINETKDSFTLKNGIEIRVLTGDFRTIRGYTLVGAIVDEAAFFGLSEESKVKSDTELIRALTPGLATTNGKLIVISSPYAKRGWCYNNFKKFYGNDRSSILIWNCPSRTMNPTLPKSVVQDALKEDYQAAQSEFLGLFRDDISNFISPEIFEKCIVENKGNDFPSNHNYTAFVDISGGRQDDTALAIGHKKDDKVIIDYLQAWDAPHSPSFVIFQISEILKKWGIYRVIGDNYASEFVSNKFQTLGIYYERSKFSRSELYMNFLPMVTSEAVVLPDSDKLLKQFTNLERHTRSYGKDIVDHPKGEHDDLSNVVAGVCQFAQEIPIVISAGHLGGGQSLGDRRLGLIELVLNN